MYKTLLLALLMTLAPTAWAEAAAGQAEPAGAAGEMAAEPSAEAPAQTPRPNCLRETGSRIQRREPDGCISAPGRSYDREDIERSGAITTEDALRRLSPSVY